MKKKNKLRIFKKNDNFYEIFLFCYGVLKITGGFVIFIKVNQFYIY